MGAGMAFAESVVGRDMAPYAEALFKTDDIDEIRLA